MSRPARKATAWSVLAAWHVPPADPLHHLTFEDLPPFREAIFYGPGPHHVVEREELVRLENHAVELGGRGIDVVSTALLFSRTRKPGAKAREFGVDVDFLEVFARDFGQDLLARELDEVAPGEGGVPHLLERFVQVEIVPRKVGNDTAMGEIEAGRHRRFVGSLFQGGKRREEDLWFDVDDQRKQDISALCGPRLGDAFEPWLPGALPRRAATTCARHRAPPRALLGKTSRRARASLER